MRPSSAYLHGPGTAARSRSVRWKSCPSKRHVQAARATTRQSAAERHGYDNLILLCGTHHSVIDDEEVSVERLIKMKNPSRQNATPLPDDRTASELSS
jgi:hypothetical protein